MKNSKFLIAAALTGAISAASAENTFVDLASGSRNFVQNFSTGSNVVTFSGLASGIYNVAITNAEVSNIDPYAPFSATLTTGSPGGTLLGSSSGSFRGNTLIINNFSFTTSGASTPLFLTLTGTAGNYPFFTPLYYGTVSVSAVPEPSTYALMLAGLGAAGFVARRRKNASV